jgi:phosphoglycolate phosphatase-like HAD superfamily hydrolase
MDLQNFVKQKEYLICVDSDGCAMDTMDIKHKKCFGPCLVAEWGLEQWGKEILHRWNVINLYSETRGINRFKGLLMMLQEVNNTYKPIEGLTDLERWVNTTREFSNASLQKEIEKTQSVCLQKALHWSVELNHGIDGLRDEEKQPFVAVKETLALLHSVADIAIVSSANGKAVVDEWNKYGLAEHVDIMLTQEMGDKTSCIRQMRGKGYQTENTLMVGDAVGDWNAAETNGVLFFPILVGNEEQSWQRLQTEALPQLLNGTYRGDYQQALLKEFYDNFHKNDM